MTRAITAAVVREPGGPFSIERLSLESPRAGEVLVRIVATGPCRSDIEAAHGVIPPAAPVVLGHESAGVVEQVGAGVTHVVPGDHVVLTFPFCGECRSCLGGAVHHCERLFALAISGGRLDGTSPVAVMASKIRACDPIVVVDKTPSRLALAKEFGATMVLNPADGDVEARIGERGGADFSIEATGVSAVAEIAVRVLRPFGVCALVGVGAPGAKLTLAHAHLTLGRSVIGVLEGNSQTQSFIPELVAVFLNGDLPIDRLVREYDLADINQAVADVGDGQVTQPILRPTLSTPSRREASIRDEEAFRSLARTGAG